MNAFAAIGIFVIAVPVIIIAVAILSTMWRAWWLYPAWDWFIVPLGLRHISFWHFTALMFLLSTLTQHIDTKKDDRKQEWVTYPIMVFWPILVWIILRWMR